MATQTLNELIISAISGAEQDEVEAPPEVGVEKTASATTALPIDGDIEKLASALEFVGRRGIDSFTKTASHGPETNEGTHLSNHTQSQVTSSPGVTQSPMSPSGTGATETNESTRPGGGGTQADGASKQMTHHSALGSNQAAIDFDKKEKAKMVSPSLSAVLDAKPFADSKLKENLDNTGADKNIHSKSASDNRESQIREALASKLSDSYKEQRHAE